MSFDSIVLVFHGFFYFMNHACLKYKLYTTTMVAVSFLTCKTGGNDLFGQSETWVALGRYWFHGSGLYYVTNRYYVYIHIYIYIYIYTYIYVIRVCVYIYIIHWCISILIIPKDYKLNRNTPIHQLSGSAATPCWLRMASTGPVRSRLQDSCVSCARKKRGTWTWIMDNMDNRL